MHAHLLIAIYAFAVERIIISVFGVRLKIPICTNLICRQVAGCPLRQPIQLHRNAPEYDALTISTPTSTIIKIKQFSACIYFGMTLIVYVRAFIITIIVTNNIKEYKFPCAMRYYLRIDDYTMTFCNPVWDVVIYDDDNVMSLIIMQM